MLWFAFDSVKGITAACSGTTSSVGMTWHPRSVLWCMKNLLLGGQWPLTGQSRSSTSLLTRRARLIGTNCPYASCPSCCQPRRSPQIQITAAKGNCVPLLSPCLPHHSQLLCPQLIPAAAPSPSGPYDSLTSNYSSPLSTFLNFLKPLFHTDFKFTKLSARIIQSVPQALSSDSSIFNILLYWLYHVLSRSQ